jgi:hypothetical protein
MTDDGLFLFDTLKGRNLARDILKTRTPRPIHDYILEGVCKLLDGVHVLSVVRTGGGKSSYASAYIHILHALNTHPSPSKLRRKSPVHPVNVVVYPTKGLQEEQVRDHQSDSF